MIGPGYRFIIGEAGTYVPIARQPFETAMIVPNRAGKVNANPLVWKINAWFQLIDLASG